MNFKLHYWPALLTGWCMLSFIVSYTVAVLAKNVYPFFPYISETGAWQPSSCVFGQMMNITAVIVAISLYIRYRQVDFAIKTNTSNLKKRWNEIEFWLGFIIALGISIVANFQGDMNGYKGVLMIHIIGALMAFGVGGIYLAIQTKITFDLQPYYAQYTNSAVSKSIQYFRLFATILFFISFVLVFAFAAATMNVFNSDGHKLQWLEPGDAGYGYRLVSTISEWVLAIIFFLYILSVTNEFKALSFEEICFKRI